jgi:hypothetical protein
MLRTKHHASHPRIFCLNGILLHGKHASPYSAKSTLSPKPFLESLILFNKALNHFIANTKCLLIAGNSIIDLLFDVCGYFSRFYCKQNDLLWYFIIVHLAYCFPEFLTLIKGSPFTPSSLKKTKQKQKNSPIPQLPIWDQIKIGLSQQQ